MVQPQNISLEQQAKLLDCMSTYHFIYTLYITLYVHVININIYFRQHSHPIHRNTNKQENQYNHNGHNQKPNQRTTAPRNSTRRTHDPNMSFFIYRV